MSTRASPFLAALRPLRGVGGDTEGGVAIEYGLIAALIVVAILGALSELGAAVVDLPLSTIISAIAGALT